MHIMYLIFLIKVHIYNISLFKKLVSAVNQDKQHKNLPIHGTDPSPSSQTQLLIWLLPQAS